MAAEKCTRFQTVDVLPCVNILSADFDAVIVVTDDPKKNLNGELDGLLKALNQHKEINKNAENEVIVLHVEQLPSRRFIYSPTGPLSRHFDDVRRVGEAAKNGLEKAIKSGSQAPLLVTLVSQSFPQTLLVSVLGALHACYVPIENREFNPTKPQKISMLGVWGKSENELKLTISTAVGLESGRGVCRDIGGSDPERMAAPNVADYVKALFSGSAVTVEVIADVGQIEKEYPLLGAVNRAAKHVERHQARVILLTYVGGGTIDTTVCLVGKGVTYDTGGADIKAGGIMAGMHRDKCGAAAVAGFFQCLNALKPKGIKVIGAMAMVRNSVGSDCYVSDEIITSRSGLRVRIGNTDAEGRMAMGDLLCLMREKAEKEVNPHIYTIATLTGHAVLAVGEGYSIVIDNGAAKANQEAQQLQAAGDILADPFEISTLRREDYGMNVAKSEYEDLLQCNNLASSRTPRGHQFPAAFLDQVSGLEKNARESNVPIKYSHLDIAASSGPFPGVPTGAPILALAGKYILKRV